MTVSVGAKTVGLIVAAAFVGTWVGATMTGNAGREQAMSAPSGPRPIGSSQVVAPQTHALQQRTTASPLPERGRNPFRYGPRVPARAASRERAPEPAVMAAPLPMPAPVPVFRLSGIASDTVDGATFFTAILNDNGALVFAKAGDKLSNGYSVVRVEELSVTLVDGSGVTQTIKLP